MKQKIKMFIYVVVILFLVYTLYRNMKLHVVPSVDLIKDEATATLYSKILPNTDNLVWRNYYYSHDSLTASEIPEAMRFNIAYRNTGSSMPEIKEEKIKKAYENVFGKNSYKKVNSFIGGCNTYIYDNDTKQYISNKRETCTDKGISVLSKIVDAKMSDKTQELTVVIAYIDNNKKQVYYNCNKDMTSCNGIIKKNVTDFDEDSIDNNDKKLNRYIFTYNSDNGEYYFNSVRKIK